MSDSTINKQRAVWTAILVVGTIAINTFVFFNCKGPNETYLEQFTEKEYGPLLHTIQFETDAISENEVDLMARNLRPIGFFDDEQHKYLIE